MMILFVIFLTSCEKDSVSNVLQVDEETELRVKKSKINVCHYDASVGSWKIISINENAWAAHARHGDVKLIDNDMDGFVNSENECGIPVDCDDTNSALTNNCSDGTITYEGQTYATKLMPDGKWWMAENLNVGTRIEPTGLPWTNSMTDNGIIEKFCYDNNETNCDTYGGLYQWDEVMQYTTTEGAQGICPDGWHLPTYDEWFALVNSIPGPDKGSRLADNAALWKDGRLDQNVYFGTSGFDALPAGYFASGFLHKDIGTYFWTSTKTSFNPPWTIQTFSLWKNPNPWVDYSRWDEYPTWGLCVRCVKD